MRATFISTAVVVCVLLACLPVAYVAGRASVSDKHEIGYKNHAEKADFKSREEQQIVHIHKMVKDDEIKNENDLPYSFSTDLQTPRYYQENRGTCWDLATIGILEQSYRAYGYEKGFLNKTKNEYVRLNPQAYGISVIDACSKHPDVCDVPGDLVYQEKSTEGGEIWWLYYLKELYTKVLPSAVCPYQKEVSGEHDCPGMQEALKNNPLKFDVGSMETVYNVFDTKRLMVTHKAPLAWSSAMHDCVYYFPCSDPYWKGTVGCSSRLRVKCPTDRYYGSQYCAVDKGPMYDMDGEFIIHTEIAANGGHTMNVVGYNDGFTTKQGYTGGFIIRNSWYDLVYYDEPDRGARGSHSIAYWMQQISEWDERKICPGPLNPENWMSCVEELTGPRGDAPKGSNDYDLTNCLNDTSMKHLVEVSLQPVEFECLDDRVCDKGANFRYFLINLDHSAEQDLVRVCMLRYDNATEQKEKICTPYHFPGKVSYWFRPVQWQLDKLKDDEDLCGFWFWPYDVLNKQVGMVQQFFVNWFDIKWDDQSYVANKAKYPNLNYTWLEKSTFPQKTMDFYSPSPFAKQRYD